MKITSITKINKRQKMLPAFFVALLFFFVNMFLFSPVAEAAINKEINYQGKLTNTSNIAVANGTYNMEFKLYTAGGATLWTETRTGGNRVQVSSGLFSVMLGEISSLSAVDFNQTLYLGVNIGGTSVTPAWDGEMSPRKKLGVVPAAIEAERAVTATKSTNLIGGNSTSLLGAIPYQSDTDTTSFVSPNVTITKKFFSMTGTGTNGATPLWEALVAGDVGLGNVTNESKTTMFTAPTFTGNTLVTGNLTVDTNTLFVDSVNHNVGIGTTTPSKKLSISSGNIGVTAGFGLVWENDANRIMTPEDNVAGALIMTPGVLRVMTGGTSEKFRISSDGNVGIGTISPTTTLDIVGDFKVGTSRKLYYSGTGSLSIQANEGGGWSNNYNFLGQSGNVVGGFGVLGNGDSLERFYIGTYSSDEKISILENGRVGIGTTTPGYKLDIIGTGLLLHAGDTSYSEGEHLIAKFGPATTDGSVSIGYQADGITDNYGIVRSQHGVDLGLGAGAPDHLYIKQGGNVGIGTTSPGAKLEVNGNVLFPNLNGVYLKNVAGNNAPAFRANSTDYINIGDDTTWAGINFYPGSATGMVIKNGGNVGIGVTNPLRKLVVSGPDDGNPQLRLMGTADTVRWWDIGRESAVTGRFKINEYNNGAETERLTILMGGNVGIGKTNPGALLQVGDHLKLKADGTITWGNQSAQGELTWSPGVAYVMGMSGQDLSLGANGIQDKIYIKSDGNVGIGTTGPVARLAVRGPGSTASTYSFEAMNSAGATRFIVRDDGRSIFYKSDNSESLTISESGKVGIGESSPSYKLDVAGSIGADGAVYSGGYSLGDSASDNMLTNGDFEMGLTGWGGFTSTTTTSYSGGLAGIATGDRTILSEDFIPVNPLTDVLQLEGWFKKTNDGANPGLLYFGYIAYDQNKNGIYTSPCGTYCYFAASSYSLTNDGSWHRFNATTTGEGTSYPQFPVGTKYVKVLVLINYSGSSDTATAVDHITLRRINNGPLFVGNNFTGTGMADHNQLTKMYTASSGNFIIEPYLNRNVGIGTTSPGAKLDLYDATLDNTAFKSMLRLGVNNNTESYYGSFNESAPSYGIEFTRDWDGGGQRNPQAGIYAWGSSNWGSGLAFRTAGTSAVMGTRAVITSSGDFGIGTNNPGAKLSVNGNIELKGNPGSTRYILTDETDTGTTHFIIQAGAGSAAYGGALNLYGNSHSTMPGSVTVGLSAVSGSKFTINDQGVAGGNNIFTVLRNGSVGIGTTSPQKILDVVGGINNFVTVGARMLSPGEWTGIHFGYREENVSYRKSAIVFERADTGYGDGSGSIHILNDGSGTSNSADLGDARLTINRIGNVGIGDTNPSVKLDVTGRAFVDTSGTYSTSYVWGGSAFQTNSLEIMDRYNGSTSDGVYPTIVFHDYGNGGAQFSMEGSTTTLHLGSGAAGSAGTLGGAGSYFSKLKVWGGAETTGNISVGGNLGVGTTTPVNKLEITTEENVDNLLGLTVASGSYGMIFGLDYTTGNGIISGRAAGINHLGISVGRNNGNVGIGITNPATKLDVGGSASVAGDLTINGSGTFAIVHNALWDHMRMYQDGASAYLDAGGSESGLAFRVDGTAVGYPASSYPEVMRLLPNGNVGIGTSNPGSKLTIHDGNMHLTSSSILGTFTTINPSHSVAIQGASAAGNYNSDDRDTWVFKDPYTGGNWGIYSRNIGTTDNGLPGNSIGFIGDTSLKAFIGLSDGNGYFAGNVGIGITTPGNILTIQQASATDPIADAWTTYSSGRWKENRVPIVNILDKINELNPVYYDWTAEYGGAHDLGFIAEEMGVVIPEVVAWEDNGVDAKSIDYARLSTIAIAGIKEMNLNIGAITGTIIPTPGSQEEVFANNFFDNIFAKVGSWLGEIDNGLEKIFVKEIRTKKLCVLDEEGVETCVIKSQLDALLASAGESDAGSGDDGLADGDEAPFNPKAPVVSLNGEAVINLIKGDTYEEQGATVTDDVDVDLVATISGEVDTSIVGSYTLSYTATDTEGYMSIPVIRTVNVEEPAALASSSTPSAPESDTSTPPASTSGTTPASPSTTGDTPSSTTTISSGETSGDASGTTSETIGIES